MFTKLEVATEFHHGEIPSSWVCPTCNKGGLVIKENEHFHETQSVESNALFEEGYIGPEDLALSFNARLTCTNTKCGEQIMALGSGIVMEEPVEDERGNYDLAYVNCYTVKYFYPTLKIIQVPTQTPESILVPLEQSFALFFCDSDACGNKIRISIEALLDEEGVDSTKQNKKGKEIRINLHDRIELMQADESTKTHLEAIKWLGNAASHEVQGLSKQDTLDAYEILRFVLNTLYDDSEARINKLAAGIKAAKGPVRANKS